MSTLLRVKHTSSRWISRSIQSELRARSFARCATQLERASNISRAEDEQQEDQPPSKKAPLETKLLGLAIGAGAALAFAAYRRSRQPQQGEGAALDGFTKYTLVDKEAVSSTCSIFTIAPLTGRKSVIDQKQHQRSIQSVMLKQPDLQIARSYTILPSVDGQADAIRLLIRKEAKGEVSGYLHDLPVGSDVEIRGPYVDLALPNDTANVVFIAGGTGIAPALKVADILGRSANVHVLWASRRGEDCAGGQSDHVQASMITNAKSWFGLSTGPSSAATQEKNTLVLMLDILKLQAKQKLSVDYFVDEQQSYLRPHDVARLLRSVDTGSKNNLIVVSGPDGFIYHWAGAKEYINGQQGQGRLGGVLSKLDLTGWQVIKL